MKAPGLRLQIVLALVGVMAIAFLPLYFALASLAHLTMQSAREDSARALGRAVAAHASHARLHGERELARVLGSDVGPGGVEAICVYTTTFSVESCAGDRDEIAHMSPPPAGSGESSTTVRGASGRALEVVVPDPRGPIVARMRTDDRADRSAPLVRLVAGYMAVFAVAIAFLVYASLTRLIVRPVEQLSRAADRVATGASRIEVPRAGARELVELSASVHAMTARLVREEESLRDKVTELERAKAELEHAQAQLLRSERLASVGRLSAGLAHEIGNPITAIMGMVDLLLAGDLPADEQRDFLTRMRKETDRIHHVIGDLLAFSRPDEVAADSTGSIEPPGADVLEVTKEAIALARPQRAFKSVSLELDAGDAPLIAAIAPRRLSQVLVNLVLNAGDALADRGEGRVTLRSRQEGDRVRIDVEDDGPGVRADVRDRLFEPFVTTKEVGRGTGLGLAVCRGIVEAAGGTIMLDDSCERGARFVIALPRLDA